MANWSQYWFLQSLGWATLNSFWQMALLWCIYLAANFVFKISSQKKYGLAVAAIVSGFAWFVFTFIYYFKGSSFSGFAFFNPTFDETNRFLNTLLLSASLTYLCLLIFPCYRLIKNWQFVQHIKKQGLQKADLNYRLFVQKISVQLAIGKNIFVYLSQLVTSPATVGYLKPIILLPLAALSNLSTRQVEAILLHELSHIKRYDYLVNFLISIISTFLYFNPFVKQFIKTIDEERENCCDELVLQFGYDKVGYASALLTLEKLSVSQHALALGAAGKNYLLNRIEKIVGMPASQSDREKKKGFRRNQLAGLLAALFCIVVFNSVLIIKDKKQNNNLYASADFGSPFNLFDAGTSKSYTIILPNKKSKAHLQVASAKKNTVKTSSVTKATIQEQTLYRPQNNIIINVSQDDVEASLTNEQKEKVKITVDATKKLVGNLQWKEVENIIADVLTEKEKLLAKKEYLDELNKTVDWKNIEQNMKAQYQNINWEELDSKINYSLAMVTLDSLQKTYTVVLNQLNNLTNGAKAEVNVCPLPDQSIREIQKTKEELSSRVNTIKALRSNKKIIRL